MDSICSICSSSPVIEGCICQGEINLICSACKISHRQDMCIIHDPIDLSLALKFISDDSYFQHYLVETYEVSKLMTHLTYSKSMIAKHLKSFNQNKELLLKELNLYFDEVSENYKESLLIIKEMMKKLAIYKSKFDNNAKEIVKDYYQETDLRCLTNEIQLPIKEILDFVRHTVIEQYDGPQEFPYKKQKQEDADSLYSTGLKSLNDPPYIELSSQSDGISSSQDYSTSQLVAMTQDQLSEVYIKMTSSPVSNYDDHFHQKAGSRYIYTSYDKKTMARYDIKLQETQYIPLDSLKHDLGNVCFCELPNGNVFITGFGDPITGDTYLYDVSTNICQKLDDLPNPRCLASLCHHENYVYVFGGQNKSYLMRDANRYNLETHKWETLEDLHKCRYLISSVVVKDKIYLFSGGYSNIEVYNTQTGKYKKHKIRNKENRKNPYGVASLYHDSIYLVTDYYIQAYTLQLEYLYAKPLNSKYSHRTCSNIVIYNGDIYFYNLKISAIEKIPSNLSAESLTNQESDKFLCKLSHGNNELNIINISNHTASVKKLRVKERFEDFSLCLLPNNLIFIAGSLTYENSRSYIYNLNTLHLKPVPGLKPPRHAVGLAYLKNTVFCFGGCSIIDQQESKISNRFDLGTKTWSTLQDMQYARSYAQCIVIDNIIYIFGGLNTTVEIFNADTLKYRALEIDKADYYGIGCYKDNLIYMLGKVGYQIFDTDLREIDRYDGECKTGESACNTGNTVHHDGKFYYYDQMHEILGTFDVETKQRKIVIININ
jgi:hypothetical protein